MKLWVDDLRSAPDGWHWAINSQIAINLLDSLGHCIEEISLDHDLGGEDTTRRVVLWMCEQEVWPSRVHVHTANPVGREWLEGMISRYKPQVLTPRNSGHPVSHLAPQPVPERPTQAAVVHARAATQDTAVGQDHDCGHEADRGCRFREHPRITGHDQHRNRRGRYVTPTSRC